MNRDTTRLRELLKKIEFDGIAANALLSKDPLEGIQERIRDYCDTLFPCLTHFHVDPAKVSARFKGVVVAIPATEEERSINAWVHLKDNSFKVFINDPLLKFGWHTAELWAAYTGGSDMFRPDTSPQSLEKVAAAAKSLLSATLKGTLDHKFENGLDLSKEQYLVAINIAWFSEHFILAHEIAHAAIRYDRYHFTELLHDAEELPRHHFGLVKAQFPESEAMFNEDALVAAWAEELVADFVGCLLAIYATTKEKAGQRVLIYATAELTFLTLDLWESFYITEFVKKRPPVCYLIKDHPHSILRLAYLRRYLGHSLYPNTVESYCKKFYAIQRELVKKMGLIPIATAEMP